MTLLLDLIAQDPQHAEVMAVGRSGTAFLLDKPSWSGLSKESCLQGALMARFLSLPNNRPL